MQGGRTGWLPCDSFGHQTLVLEEALLQRATSHSLNTSNQLLLWDHPPLTWGKIYHLSSGLPNLPKLQTISVHQRLAEQLAAPPVLLDGTPLDFVVHSGEQPKPITPVGRVSLDIWLISMMSVSCRAWRWSTSDLHFWSSYRGSLNGLRRQPYREPTGWAKLVVDPPEWL